MQYNVKKYMIDTEENKVFLREIRENLLNFGHRFPSPWGSSYYLGTTEHHGRITSGKHGLPVVWHMCTVSAHFLVMKEVESW